MQAPRRVSKEKYVESMRAEMEGLLGEVMDAVNDAPGGRVIVDSEEQVRQLMHEFRQRVFERAVQMRADSAESAFPPPENEATQTRMRDKGRQKHTLMTANGRIRVWRKRWQPARGGSLTPIDEWLDQTRETFTRGVVELACRLNRHVSGFQELSVTLWRAAGLKIGKETLHALVEAEGTSLLEKARQGELRPDWQAPIVPPQTAKRESTSAATA